MKVRMVDHNGSGKGPAFWCPACACAHGGFPEWALSGTEDAPTIVPSYLVRHGNLPGDVICHCVVTNGRIFYCPDSTHALAGQTVDMVEWP